MVAPSRWGAHNWEAVGALSASCAVRMAARYLSKFPQLLPQMSPPEFDPALVHPKSSQFDPDLDRVYAVAPGILAGHSMGGHGAILSAVNAPDNQVCLVASSSWLAKEQ